jgi:hypothetical protein
MAFQVTTITTSIGVITMLGAWLYVGQRIKQSDSAVMRPVRLLNFTFLFMAIFFTLMTIPGIWLSLDPTQFPLYMGWGYVVGHIFLYLAFISIGRMIFAMIPRLASKEWLVAVIGGTALVAVTIFNAITMIWGTLPSFNYDQHVTQFNANPIVGATIGILAALTFLPAGILFLRNAFKSQGAKRTRSFLLGIGFITMVVAGPPHDIASTWQVYMFGDILAILSTVLVAGGVIYRFGEGLSLAKPAAEAPLDTSVVQ